MYLDTLFWVPRFGALKRRLLAKSVSEEQLRTLEFEVRTIGDSCADRRYVFTTVQSLARGRRYFAQDGFMPGYIREAREAFEREYEKNRQLIKTRGWCVFRYPKPYVPGGSGGGH